VKLVGGTTKPRVDRYSIVQPRGTERGFARWIAEVNRITFLSQIGNAIVRSSVLVIYPRSGDPVVATGSHDFSNAASQRNDENLVIVRGHTGLARAYAAHIMSVYQHYRWRSYVRQTIEEGKKPWSNLDDDDKWLKAWLKSKAFEIASWDNA
jgi:phosphatidylserine/phosphatidylglycerophosphate/cardiolipin synthase-like enzyme